MDGVQGVPASAASGVQSSSSNKDGGGGGDGDAQQAVAHAEVLKELNMWKDRAQQVSFPCRTINPCKCYLQEERAQEH